MTAADVCPARSADHPGYPLDQITPVRHVMTVLVLARGQSRSIDELMAGCPVSDADISRIIGMEEGIEDDVQACRWMVERSIANLRPQLIESGGRFRLPVPAEQMTWDDQRVHLLRPGNDPTLDRGPRYYRCVCLVDPTTNQYAEWNPACELHDCAGSMEERPWPDDLRLIDQIEARS